jgi:hypothetical protein
MTMQELTAEQKIRQTMTGNPLVDPQFQHEGEDVVRWITGGTMPDLHVTFQHEGDYVVVKCATCKNILGYLPADGDQSDLLAQMRQSGHPHH